jgi:misacylated tRNA(Ala) deacylase
MTKELYQDDSYLQECETAVKEIDGDKVILDQTIFYPTGGGQEHDTGFLFQDNHEFEVYKVKKENGQIVHYVKNADQLRSNKATCKLDWERRYGLMRHHSMLHVFGAVLYTKYGALCTGNQIYPDRARIDFNELHDLTEEQIQETISETNREIRENHPISTRYIDREEVDLMPGAIKTVVSLLPPTVRIVRLVKIGYIDEQACGGTHLNATNEIGEFRIIKIKSKGSNNKRFEVVGL